MKKKKKKYNAQIYTCMNQPEYIQQPTCDIANYC